MRRLLSALGLLALLPFPAYANGLIIYREQGFHSDQQSKLTEYVTAEVIPQTVSVTLKTGNRLDIPAGRFPVLIPFPDVPLEKPDEAIKLIDSAIARFPQHKIRLESLKKEWIDKIGNPIHEKPVEPASEPIFTARNGTKFMGVTDIKALPNGLTISHKEGVSKVSFYNLTDEQIKQYNLTRKAADEFTAQQKEIRKLVTRIQQQKTLGQLQKKEFAELEKKYGFNSAGIAVQVIPGSGMFYKGYRIEDFIDIEQRVEDCLANNSTDPRFPKRKINVKVKKQREVPIGDHELNLSFIEGPTGNISDGDAVSARLYQIGTYPYTNTLGETRRIPQFTKAFEKFSDYYEEQK